MQRETASPSECVRIFGIPHYLIRRAIANGELVPRAVGRKSILFLEDVRAWIRAHPPTKSSRAKYNGECHAQLSS